MTSNNIPGMPVITQIGMVSGNPRDAAMTDMNNNAKLQAEANAALRGGRLKRRRKYRGGNTQTIAVPQFNMPYAAQGGPGTNPNDQIQANAATSTQGFANAAYDAAAFKKGGSRRTRRTRRTRKTRKTRKTRRTRK